VCVCVCVCVCVIQLVSRIFAATTDIRDLQLFEPADANLTWEKAFGKVLTDEVLISYSRLLQLARQVNAGPVPAAEFVLLGHIGSGKSSLIEMLTGVPSSSTVGSGASLRPVFFQWVTNKSLKVVTFLILTVCLCRIN
jgi:hypothetical protein